ncbi:Galactoside 2-alpha-L-fucosyltransferase [Cucurbita argyrosperma subsp. argyrosperma]|nr:Galactoside 2-alpha-L-fucosyltransferase [Cucurbita argyrosperma subsp. argyrosperma]
MTRGFRRRNLCSKPIDRLRFQASADGAPKSGFLRDMKVKEIFTYLLIGLPLVVFVGLVFRNPAADLSLGFAEARALERVVTNGSSESSGSENGFSRLSNRDKLIGGLLIPGFDEASCLSRYQSSLYRRISTHRPSPYLISKLREYEALHRRCGPHTKPYDEAVEQLRSGSSVSLTECKYVVWMSYSGLGNKILTLASAFLYAVLTDRVLLVDPGKDMADLFCEPFPEKTWLLPNDFPLMDQFSNFNQKSPNCHGYMLKTNTLNESTEALPSYLYLHLVHDYDDHDKLFFCDQEQALLSRVPWLILKTDNYFVPSLFLIPSFEHELSNLFPQKDNVFHHLGRYLFHPSNHVWGLITRYYDAYLSSADELIGIQVRVFEIGSGPFEHIMDQILSCTLQEKILPDLDKEGFSSVPLERPRVKAVLMTSLSSGYYEKLRTLYWEYPTITGEVIAVHQPSYEMYQQTEKKAHNRKAWAEMYLLSMSDVLVTSAWSTFGYVAQGLGGSKPWILYKAENMSTPDPACGRAMSMEPCFHAPPFYDCKAKKGIDTGVVVPHVRHCEDMSWGLKLVHHQDL